MQVNQLFVQFQNHPQAWLRVDAILEKSQVQEAKLLALRILEDAVKTKWKPLPKEQKEGIKSFIVGLIIKISSSPELMKQQAALLKKLDVVLVQVGEPCFADVLVSRCCLACSALCFRLVMRPASRGPCRPGKGSG